MTKIFFFWAMLSFFIATTMYLLDKSFMGNVLLGLQFIAAGLFTREFEK